MEKGKRIGICLTAVLVGLFLALSCLLAYAYFAKKDIYDGYISGQVELLFDRLDDEGIAAYAAAEGVAADKTSDWGTRENPYVISNVRHLYNLSELQRLGYFKKKHLDQNEDGDLSHIPYFLVSTSKYEPTVIDGSHYRAIAPIGTEEYPFVGSVKGVRGGTCEIGGYSADTSILYNVQVRGTPHDPDAGLFGHVSFLGTPTEEGSFLGTPSVLSSLVLYDVQVKVDASLFDAVTAFIEDIALSAGGHRYSFTELYRPDHLTDYEAVPHENHHIGILAGHISYSIVEYISVFYSSGEIAAIDLSDSAPVGGVAPNYFSAAGILGFIYNLNPEYDEQSGSLEAGSGSNTSDLYYGIVGGGGLEVGDKAGYVLAKTIYHSFGHTADGEPLGDGATFLIKDAYDENGNKLCAEWIANGQGTGQHYFYDGVFTFALSSPEDTIVNTFGTRTPTLSLGSTDPSGWHTNNSEGQKLITAYLRRITSETELKTAAESGLRLVVMHEATVADPFMLSLYEKSASSGSGRLNQRFTTAGVTRKYTDAETLAKLREEYLESPEKFLDAFEEGTDAALVDAIMGSLDAGDGTYSALALDLTEGADDPLVELTNLRKQYKIYAAHDESYGYSYFMGNTPVTADTGGMTDYYDYNESSYDGYFYYTGSWPTFYYYWQPKNGNTVDLGYRTNILSGNPDFSRQGSETWRGENVYTRDGYVGVVVNGNNGNFYNSGNTANANGASLRKPLATKIGYFFRPAGSESYYYMSDTKLENPIGAAAFASAGTSDTGLPLYRYGGNTGVLLDRYDLYTFHSPAALENDAKDDNYMRMIKANFSWRFGGSQYTLWNGTDDDAEDPGKFESSSVLLGTLGTPETVENSIYATVRFNEDGSCYIEYTIGTVAQLMRFNGTAFDTALARGENTKLNIYVLETTQAVNSGTITFDPDEETDHHILAGDEYLLWPQGAVEVEAGGTKSSVDESITDAYSVVSLTDLRWNNGDALDNGGILHRGNMDKKFHMTKGIRFGATISLKNLFGGIFGDLLGGIDDFASAGIVQAPVGPEGTKANIPAGCVAFRVNKVTSEGQKIRVIVALPTSPYYEGAEGYDLGDYTRYFCLWKMPEASTEFLEIFRADDYVERFELPRSHTYEPGTTASSAHSEYITVSYGGNSYRSYLNGERILVAYEFVVREVGIYVLGTSTSSNDNADEAPMEIVYFSAGGVASAGRDGASGSQIGTVDYVYAYGGKIVTVTESASDSEAPGEDYNNYYPSYCLLYMLSEAAGDGGFTDINSELVYIERTITDEDPPASSDGYRTTASYATVGFRRLRDKLARVVQYSRLADNVIETE